MHVVAILGMEPNRRGIHLEIGTMDRFHLSTFISLRLILAFSFALVAMGCGVDFAAPVASGGSNPNILAGTWNGSIEMPAGTQNVVDVSIQFDNQGQVASMATGGTDWGVVGTVSGVPGESRLFIITLADGAGTLTQVGLYTDGSFKHAGWVDEDLNVAVIEKNGQLPPGTYVDSDLWGNTTARIVNIDAGFNITGTTTSNVGIYSDNSVFGYDTELGNFTGTLNVVDPANGFATGSYDAPDVGITGGVLSAILSPDKSFVGSYACSPTVAFGNCGFRVWSY